MAWLPLCAGNYTTFLNWNNDYISHKDNKNYYMSTTFIVGIFYYINMYVYLLHKSLQAQI